MLLVMELPFNKYSKNYEFVEMQIVRFECMHSFDVQCPFRNVCIRYMLWFSNNGIHAERYQSDEIRPQMYIFVEYGALSNGLSFKARIVDWIFTYNAI